jgi:hypothetical protein
MQNLHAEDNLRHFYIRPKPVMLCCVVLCPCAGVATERAQFMDLVRQQVSQLQDTHGTDSPTLTFTGGSLRAVRPEELSDTVSVFWGGSALTALADLSAVFI